MSTQTLLSTEQKPILQKLQSGAHFLLPIALGLLLFFLTISSTGKSIFLGLSMTLILFLMSTDKKKAFQALNHPLSLLGITLLAWTLIAMLWSPAQLNEKLDLLKHYSKLLFIPLFLFAFREEAARRWVVPAFFIGMMLTVLVSLLNTVGLTHWYSLDPTAMFRNHIMTSFMMATASFMAATYACKSKRYKWLYGILSLLFGLHVLFLNTGRMGYIIFFALAFTFLVQHMAKKQLIIGLIAGLITIGVIAAQSSVIQNQFNVTKRHILIYQKGNKETSVGLRFQFYEFAYRAIKRKPLLGNGTGSYHHLFATGSEFKPGSPGSDDPHNQYIFIWFEQGLIGLLIFSGFLVYGFWAARNLPQNKLLAQGLVIAFALGSMTDSYLFRSGTGFLFCILMAFFYAENLRIRK